MTAPTLAHFETGITHGGRRVQIAVRDGTSDLSLVLGHMSIDWAVGGDEYDIGQLRLTGTFVDVGAHIGAVALAVLADNPNSRAILVEPLPENLALCRDTMRVNRLTPRCLFVEAAVGSSTVRYGGDRVDDRYVGNIGTHDGATIEARVITLAELVELAGGHIEALKIDCEGGEWAFLQSPALAQVDLIFGEWHGNTRSRNGRARLTRLLGRTHDLVQFTDVGGIGLFRAVRL